VLAFLSLIAARIATNKLYIQFTTEMGHMDETQRASVNRMLQIFREKITTHSRMNFSDCSLSNIQFLADLDNKMDRIECSLIEETEIPILMQFLASPRPDGKQRVLKIYWIKYLELAQKLFDAIKEVHMFRMNYKWQTKVYFSGIAIMSCIAQCLFFILVDFRLFVNLFHYRLYSLQAYLLYPLRGSA
jgi:hypothetical protein